MLKLFLKLVTTFLLLIGSIVFVSSHKMSAEEYAGWELLVHGTTYATEHHSERPFYFELKRLQNRELLDFSNHNLSELPPEIGQLQNLRYLYFDCNPNQSPLHELPPEIGQLQSLKVLRLTNSNLDELPPEIGLLHNLELLILTGNKLNELPPEIGQLQSLKELNLYNNNLHELPPEIGQLQSLKELNLYNNNLHELPPEIGLLSNLQTFMVGGNPLSPGYPTYSQDLLQYLRQQGE